jgi:hypothetical protein
VPSPSFAQNAQFCALWQMLSNCGRSSRSAALCTEPGKRGLRSVAQGVPLPESLPNTGGWLTCQRGVRHRERPVEGGGGRLPGTPLRRRSAAPGYLACPSRCHDDGHARSAVRAPLQRKPYPHILNVVITSLTSGQRPADLALRPVPLWLRVARHERAAPVSNTAQTVLSCSAAASVMPGPGRSRGTPTLVIHSGAGQITICW